MNAQAEHDSQRREKLVRVIKENWREELVVARVYRAMAQHEEDPHKRQLLSLMAVSEEEHAALWANRLAELGETVDPSEANEPFRQQNREIGEHGVSAMIRKIELEERHHVEEYQDQIRALNDPASTEILKLVIPDERAHAERLHEMVEQATGVSMRRLNPLRSLSSLFHATEGFTEEARIAALSGIGLLLGALFSGTILGTIFFLASMLIAAYPALLEAKEALQEGKLDVEILMLTAAFGAFAIGRAGEGALLLFLFALSGALESMAMGKTRDAIKRLVGMRPQRARLEDDTLVPVEQIKPGDRFIVYPGEAIPLDGIILEGRSSIDQSAMTGEAEPVSRQSGDRVVGSTLNLEGVLTIEASASSADSALERVIRLVEEAQSEKSLASSERLADRVGRYYTPLVLIGCLGYFLYLFKGVDWSFQQASYRALSLLIGASPCALVISSPAAILSALASAGRKGLLIRSGSALERLSLVNAVAFDKTGTLTKGSLEVVSVHSSDADPDRLLALAAAAESPSPHPLARAVTGEARKRGLKLPPIESHQTIAGQGVEAVIEGKRVQAGRPEWLDAPQLSDHVEQARQHGQSVIAIRVENVVGCIALRDTLRRDAQETLDDLRALGIDNLTLITGDHHQAAEALRERLNVSALRADLRPEDKAIVIDEMARSGLKVAMVGDGINDAPALAKASIGITLGGIGSDVALDSADVVIMEDRLRAVPDALRLARAARSIALQNVVISLASVALLTTSIFLKGIPLPLAVIGHEGTTVLVVLNGLRLLKK